MTKNLVMTVLLATTLCASGTLFLPVASAELARCPVNVGTCDGHCPVNVGYCERYGRCTVNVGDCRDRCAVNVGTCRDETIRIWIQTVLP